MTDITHDDYIEHMDRELRGLWDSLNDTEKAKAIHRKRAFQEAQGHGGAGTTRQDWEDARTHPDFDTFRARKMGRESQVQTLRTLSFLTLFLIPIGHDRKKPLRHRQRFIFNKTETLEIRAIPYML